jgi:hypothetical protein
MSIFSRFFGKPKSAPNEFDKLPPLYGGDALTPETAVTVNCAAMSTAKILIDRFISERLGQQGDKWSRGIECFVNKPDLPPDAIRSVSVTVLGGSSIVYYFNIARPMKGSMAVMRMLGQVPPNT